MKIWDEKNARELSREKDLCLPGGEAVSTFGTFLGGGEEGFVLGSGESAYKIILTPHEGHDWSRCKRNLKWLERERPLCVVGVEEWGYHRGGGVRSKNNPMGSWWWYRMERLTGLDLVEAGNFWRLWEAYRADRAERLRPKTAMGEQKKRFLVELSRLRYFYMDLWSQNVMKDDLGRWKVIDVESFR
jgi:hypothetical protein